MCDHRLNLGFSRHFKCSKLGLNELADIRFIVVLIFDLIVIDVRLALGMNSGFCFRNKLVRRIFQHSMLERHNGSREVDIRLRMFLLCVRNYGDRLECRLIRPTKKVFRTRSRHHEVGIPTKGKCVRHDYSSIYDGLVSRWVLGRKISVRQEPVGISS